MRSRRAGEEKLHDSGFDDPDAVVLEGRTRPALFAVHSPMRWSTWRLGAAAGGWSLCYALLVMVAPNRPFGYPFGDGPGARVAAVTVIALCLVWACAAGLLIRPLAGASRVVVLGLGWSAAVVLLLVVPTNVLMQLAFSPVTDGWVLLGHLGALAGGLVWTVLTVAVQRRTGPGCSRCGRTANAIRADSWTRPPRWLQRINQVAVLVPLLGFAVPHWLWALGVPFGTTQALELSRISGWLWLLGAAPAIGAILTSGLTRRWGQVFWSWVPVVGGGRVPPYLAFVPATWVGVLLAQYGVMMTSCSLLALTGITRSCFGTGRGYLVDNWAFTATYPVFGAWGLALIATAVGYQQLTRSRCPDCGRR